MLSTKCVTQSTGTVDYTDSFSTEGEEPPASVLDMLRKNLMARFQ